MPDWSWLDPDEDEILNTFNRIKYIRCYSYDGERFCSLYTKEGFERLIRRPTYSGEISVLDIETQRGTSTYTKIGLDAVPKEGGVKLTVIDTYDFSAEGTLECKLVRNKNTGDIILYCQDEEI